MRSASRVASVRSSTWVAADTTLSSGRTASHSRSTSKTARATVCASTTRASGAPVSCASRNRPVTPAMFTARLVSTVAMISRRSGWPVIAAGNRLRSGAGK